MRLHNYCSIIINFYITFFATSFFLFFLPAVSVPLTVFRFLSSYESSDSIKKVPIINSCHSTLSIKQCTIQVERNK